MAFQYEISTRQWQIGQSMAPNTDAVIDTFYLTFFILNCNRKDTKTWKEAGDNLSPIKNLRLMLVVGKAPLWKCCYIFQTRSKTYQIVGLLLKEHLLQRTLKIAKSVHTVICIELTFQVVVKWLQSFTRRMKWFGRKSKETFFNKIWFVLAAQKKTI